MALECLSDNSQRYVDVHVVCAQGQIELLVVRSDGEARRGEARISICHTLQCTAMAMRYFTLCTFCEASKCSLDWS